MKIAFYSLFLLSFTALSARAQVINTIAGGGTSDAINGPATAAALNNPYGVAIDHAGNIFFADRNNNRICKIDKQGELTTIAGTGKAGYSGDRRRATRAALNYPICVAVDGVGNILFSDRRNNCVRKITIPTGVITTIAGTGKPGFSGEGGEATNAQLNGPAGILVDDNGAIYICDAYNQCIRKISTAGIITTVAGNGTKSYYGEGGMALDAGLYEPYCMAIGKTGSLYFTEYGNSLVRKINARGIVTTVAGNGKIAYSGDGGPATQASLNRPTGIAIDQDGNLIIADSDNNRIRKIDKAGIITTIAGSSEAGFYGDGGTAAKAALEGPTGIALDANDNLYLADLGNNRIRVISNAADAHSAAEEEVSSSINVSIDLATTTVRFEFKSFPETSIKLMAQDGKTTATLTVHNASVASFDVKTYSPGLYSYEVIQNGKRQTGKFRIE